MDRISEMSHALASIGYDVDPVGVVNEPFTTGVVLLATRGQHVFTITITEPVESACDPFPSEEREIPNGFSRMKSYIRSTQPNAQHRQATSYEVIKLLGLSGMHLPVEGMLPQFIDGFRVWVAALPERSAGARRRRRSTHRVLTECPNCRTQLSVGRLQQHVCPASHDGPVALSVVFDGGRVFVLPPQAGGAHIHGDNPDNIAVIAADYYGVHLSGVYVSDAARRQSSR